MSKCSNLMKLMTESIGDSVVVDLGPRIKPDHIKKFADDNELSYDIIERTDKNSKVKFVSMTSKMDKDSILAKVNSEFESMLNK